jgi:LmbE family N-acetylglucosaminyl deacetylase
VAHVLAVSPHLDDAVLSAGGYLAGRAALGDEVTVYTVFAGLAGPPFSTTALRIHQVWGLSDDPVGCRRAEDRAAVAALGGVAVHGEFLDVIYRRAADGRWLIDERRHLTRSTVDEHELRGRMAAAIAAQLARRPADRLLTCAAVGNHVDHRHTRDAALEAAGAACTPVWLWEDVPYAAAGLAAPPLPPGASTGPAVAEPVGAVAWAAKCAAVGRYASQHPMVFPAGGDFRETLRAHAVTRAAELGHDGPAEVFWPVCAGAGQWPVLS